MTEPGVLAAAYLADYQLLLLEHDESGRVEDFSYLWAVEEIDELVELKPQKAIEVLHELIRLSQDDRARAYIGAGILQDLLANHGDTVVRAFEGDPQSARPILNLMKWVWPDELAPSVIERVRRLAPDAFAG